MSQTLRSMRLAVASLISITLLVGCGISSREELKQWMTEQRAQAKPKVDPLPEPKKFSPQAYTQAGAADPFTRDKLTQALRRETDQNTATAALVAPELARRKEPLEAFPLDAMSMVGSLVREGKPVALIRVDNLLYQVRPGQYLGQNYGRITKVAETEVVLREIVQDPGGEWVERTASLQLQERGR